MTKELRRFTWEDGAFLAVADALDAMTTDRPYRKAMTFGDAVLELERGRGRDFDPAVIEALKRAQLQPGGAGWHKTSSPSPWASIPSRSSDMSGTAPCPIRTSNSV